MQRVRFADGNRVNSQQMGLITKLAWIALPAIAGCGVLSQASSQGTGTNQADKASTSPTLFAASFNPLTSNKLRGRRIRSTNEFSTSVDSIISSKISKGGAGLAVIDGDQVTFLKCFGYANANERNLFNQDSVIRLASISKIFTALGILKLASMGKIELDLPFIGYSNITPVSPITDPRVKTITVRQLLSMTSGWDSSRRLDRTRYSLSHSAKYNFSTPYTPLDAAKLILSFPLEHQPGTQQSYNNENYILLGRVIESVSGCTYYDFINKEIAQPLGISTLSLASSDDTKRIKNEVQYYEESPVSGPSVYHKQLIVTRSYGALFDDRGEGNYLEKQAVCVEIADAAGGLACSFYDLVRLAVALNSNKLSTIVKPQYISQIPQPPNSVNSDSYFGLGTFFFRENINNKVYLNLVMGGVLHGINLKMHARPDGRVIVIVFNSNTSTLDKVESVMPQLHYLLNAS